MEETGKVRENSEEEVHAITCPHCGNRIEKDELYNEVNNKFRYLEDIVCFRPIEGIENGRIRVKGLYRSGEGYDDGANPRLECRKCLGEFKVPDWVLSAIDWV